MPAVKGEPASIENRPRRAAKLDGNTSERTLRTGPVSYTHLQIFAKLWSLLAPPELVQNSCLLVMGSEGRGEQILKTDQDNTLLLRDGYELSLIHI